MASGIDPSSGSASQDPYSVLGLESGATFDEVQKARDKMLSEIGEDPLARARIESSYDALLMNSLKERQLGKVSNAAASASKKEEGFKLSTLKGENNSLLTRISSITSSLPDKGAQKLFPSLSLSEGQGLIVRLIGGAVLTLLVFVSAPGSIELILAFSTIGVFISQLRRGRSPLPSLGWSVVLLSLGLILGGLLNTGVVGSASLDITLSKEQIEALPAVLLLWAGSLLLE